MTFKELESMAKSGIPEALSVYALALLKGDGSQNTKMLGEFATVINDGLNFSFDEHPERDENAAFEAFNRAADSGEVLAKRAVGKFYHFGYLTEQDFDIAIDCFRQAEEFGKNSLAEIYSEIFFSGSDFQKYFEMIAEEDDGVIIDVARRLQRGEYIIESIDLYFERNDDIPEPKSDWVTAAKLLEISAARGNVDAIFELGICRFRDEDSYDGAEAFKWFTAGAELGDDRCRYMLGRCYEYGEGVEKDAGKAKLIYKELRKKGFNENNFN